MTTNKLRKLSKKLDAEGHPNPKNEARKIFNKQYGIGWKDAANEKKKLFDLWSKVIRHRDGRCLKCGTTNNLQANHIISRKHLSTAFLLENGFTLCVKCHLYWWHEKTNMQIKAEVLDWFNNALGKPWFPLASQNEYSKLLIRSREIWNKDYFGWETYLKEKFNGLF